MFKLKELPHIALAIILFAFIISFLQGQEAYLTALWISAVILMVNIFFKKLMAYHYESETEQKIWHWQRWGYYERSHLKKPLPMGLILPFILVWLSYPLGFIKVLTFLEFDVKPTAARTAKRRGSVIQRYSEITEWHQAAIAGLGIGACLILALFAYIYNIPMLARYAVFFSVWNMLPISKLDGAKILFGGKLLWALLALFCVIGLFFAFFLI